jgi:Flp pilus assembly protein TadD
VFHYEQAHALDKNPVTLFPLGLAYLQLAMYGSALHAFNESKRRGLPPPAEMQTMLEQLRQDVGAMADEMGLPMEKAIAGLREMERGTRWLDRTDFGRAIEANRAAIRLLGDWPPPHNNLALALFFDGQVAAAIAECRRVLAHRPENITAACNLVRFLAWSGEREAAQEVWQPLCMHVPAELPMDALKLTEAAAVMDDDESVRRLLLPIGDWSAEEMGDWRHYVQVQQFLATADANMGNPKAAKRRLRALDDDDRRIQTLRDALRQGRSGLGLTSRFPYYYSYELVPHKVQQEFAALVEAAGDGSNPQAEKALKRFVARFPQLVVMAEKAIWDEDAVDFGLVTLRLVGTPAAHAALRRFAGSQAGSDEQRMNALFSLQASGGAQPGEIFRIWRNGAIHEIELRGFALEPRYDRPQYKAKAAKLMEQGQTAMHDGRWAEAADLFRQVTDLEPRAYDAFNNLAAAVDMTGDREASRALLEQALTINPDYVFARVNLAVKLLGEDVDAAVACLQPLEARTSYTPEEFVFYQYGLAQVAVARKEFEAARSLLNMVRSIDPDSKPVTKLLAYLDDIEFRTGTGEIWEKAREGLAARNAQYRRQQQAKLATLSPSVANAVGIYTAELLRPIAKAIAPWQRLTGLRKADLQRLVIEIMLEPATIEFLVNERLSDAECAALAAVLDAGGAMPQHQFRQAYGDDADESPWWQYTLPESVAGRLRLHCLLVETTVDKVVYLATPAELRDPLATALRGVTP